MSEKTISFLWETNAGEAEILSAGQLSRVLTNANFKFIDAAKENELSAQQTTARAAMGSLSLTRSRAGLDASPSRGAPCSPCRGRCETGTPHHGSELSRWKLNRGSHPSLATSLGN